MADSITTQADVLTYTTLTDNEIMRLQNGRMNSDNWEAMHIKAWTLVKGMLAMRKPAYEESDLTDSTELKKCTVYAVLYLAYNESKLSDTDKQQARYWYRMLRKEFAEVELTVNGATVGRESFGSMRAYRA